MVRLVAARPAVPPAGPSVSLSTGPIADTVRTRSAKLAFRGTLMALPTVPGCGAGVACCDGSREAAGAGTWIPTLAVGVLAFVSPLAAEVAAGATGLFSTCGAGSAAPAAAETVPAIATTTASRPRAENPLFDVGTRMPSSTNPAAAKFQFALPKRLLPVNDSRFMAQYSPHVAQVPAFVLGVKPAAVRNAVCCLASGLLLTAAGCSSGPEGASPEARPEATAAEMAGRLTGNARPPKGQRGVQASSWVIRSDAASILSQLAAAGRSLGDKDSRPGSESPAAANEPTAPPAAVDPVTLAWHAAGFRMFVISRAAWTSMERELTSRTPGAAPEGSNEPDAVDRLDGSAILGPRAWLPEGADWTEVARGSSISQDQVVAVHDGRFLAPASIPRLLCRSFEVPARPQPGAPRVTHTIIELAPQLLLPRQPDSDLSLVEGKLQTTWSRGMVLERLVGSVHLDADQVLVLLPIVTSAMLPPADARSDKPIDDPSRPGRVRTAQPAEPARSAGLGPGISLGSGPQPFAPAMGPQPTEPRPVPTIAELILAGVPERAEDGPQRLTTTRTVTRTLLVFEPVSR